MKLTKSTDFALRVLIYLAQSEKPMTMPVLSDKLGVSYHHLCKLIQTMHKAGIVQTQQGKNGGVWLMRKADVISVKDVIDVIDGPTRMVECLDGSSDCVLLNGCKLKTVFGQLQNQINTMLDGVKLSQMV